MIVENSNDSSFNTCDSSGWSKYVPAGAHPAYQWPADRVRFVVSGEQTSCAGSAGKPSYAASFGLCSLLRYNSSLARLALFVVYFWFGVLKLLGVSPAGPLVTALWLKTIPFIPLNKFMILFASYETLIGIMFLIPRLKRLAIASLLLHVCTEVIEFGRLIELCH